MFRPFDLVVADIDGTLINDEKELSEFTISVVRRVQRDFGVHMLLASSRMPRAIRPIQRQLGCLETLIALDGALVVDNVDERLPIIDRRLPLPASIEIVRTALAVGAHVGVFRGDEWIVEKMDYFTRREIRGNKVMPVVGSVVEHLTCWAEAGLAAHKIMLRAPIKELTHLQPTIKHYGNDVMLSFGRPTAIEIVSAAAGKWKAVQCILAHLGIRPERVLAFGDSDNDIELLRSVGQSVAPSNASGRALQTAGEVTFANNDNGVAITLCKYFPES
jgi:Cof subfamily protein (haloacid dehalogenase superfamily)